MSDEIVTLNVGGILCTTTTTRSTLTRYPETMLASGNYTTATDTMDNYFIDRDGKLFRYVLSYLRSSELIPLESVSEFNQLQLETEFYHIVPLIIELHPYRSE